PITSHPEEGRDEAVKALVEDQVAQALAAKRPERAAAVLDGLVAEPVAHAIGDARGGSAHPRIAVAAVDAPAGHRVPLIEMAQHPGDVVGIVLEVGVHHHYPSPPYRLEPRVSGRRLACVGLQPDEASPRILLVKAAHDLGAPVPAAVVDEDDLITEVRGVEYLADLGPEERKILFLVVDGDDDGQVDRRRGAA